MNRDYYVSLARRGLRMPIGADLVLNEQANPEAARRDGVALGRVIQRAAELWESSLAFPLMDLRLEKLDLLGTIGVAQDEAEEFQFDSVLDEKTVAVLCDAGPCTLTDLSVARDEALTYVAQRTTGLLPIGMVIGPFSLATRLMSDPITASGLAGAGMTAQDAAEIALMEQCSRIAEAAVFRSVRLQIKHGAQAVMVCEPAASTAFISPRQMEQGSDVFERWVMGPNLRLRDLLEENRTDLIFHDCGELVPAMVEAFGRRLRPAILSLGSSRRLWEDAPLIPDDVVLYGNLPTRLFYSDAEMPVGKVLDLAEELTAKMAACGHPHILGSECDILHVAEAAETIRKKVAAVWDGIQAMQRDVPLVV